MHAVADPLLNIVFEGAVIEWRGPAPYYFVAIPPEHLGEVSYAAREASYGWRRDGLPLRAYLEAEPPPRCAAMTGRGD